MRDFLGPTLEGERWLVQAAGAVRPYFFSSILTMFSKPHICCTCMFSIRLHEDLNLRSDEHVQGRRTTNRPAASSRRFPDRKEGCSSTSSTLVSLLGRPLRESWNCKWGIRLLQSKLMHLQKPLALYLFHQAYELYRQPSDKDISPSFWESEDRSPSQWGGFDAVLPGIEHELGKLDHARRSESPVQLCFRRSATLYDGRYGRCSTVLRGSPPRSWHPHCPTARPGFDQRRQHCAWERSVDRQSILRGLPCCSEGNACR